MVRLVMRRYKESEECTLGEFYLIEGDSNVMLRGYTIERPGPDSKESGKKLRIPFGTYQTIIHHSEHLKMDVPLLFNEDVSKDRYILIHVGNKASDLEGCIALGDSCNGKDMIFNSRETINKFLKCIKDKELEVKICNKFNNEDDNE